MLCFDLNTPLSQQLVTMQSTLTKDMLDLLQESQGKSRRRVLKSIHLTRKLAKRARTLLRLYQCSLPDQTRKETSAIYRDIAGILAPWRDQDALLECLLKLDETKKLPGNLILAARSRLTKVVPQSSPSKAVKKAIHKLESIVLPELESQSHFAAIEGGLRKIYRQGQSLMRQAEKSTRAGGLLEEAVIDRHEWRKRVKDLWHLLEWLHPAWPEIILPLADQTHALSSLLGDDHDLSLLNAETRQSKLASIIADQQAGMHIQAFSLGCKVYAERPRAFTRCIGAYISNFPRA